NIWYESRAGIWSDIKSTGGSILSIGNRVNGDQPMLPVYAQVNEKVLQPDGSYVEVQLSIGAADTTLMVPESSLLEDYGAHSVIVQRSGENFERRDVKIGRRNGGWVEITEGLTLGERVVSRGAYQVKMVSTVGLTPAHGHPH
ncbi:MAG: efflux RND transporter periplasmic adaptor subunit, partial [Bacteroidota bacterium]